MTVFHKIRRRISDVLYPYGPAQYYQPAYAHIAADIGLQNGTMLDVGCGPGWLCLHVADEKPDIDAVGIDNSPRMVRTARQNNRAQPNITIREMDAADIQFPIDTFDVVTAVQTAHHWANQSAVLEQIYRVMKAGGRLYLYEADRNLKDIPEEWIQRRSGWPPKPVVISGWRRFGMDDAEWSEATRRAHAMDFSNMVVDRHGFYRRMVLTK